MNKKTMKTMKKMTSSGVKLYEIIGKYLKDVGYILDARDEHGDVTGLILFVICVCVCVCNVKCKIKQTLNKIHKYAK